MKISEMIVVLQEELKKRGDVEVILYGQSGHYGQSDTFKVAKNTWLDKESVKSKKLFIWTGINTGYYIDPGY